MVSSWARGLLSERMTNQGVAGVCVFWSRWYFFSVNSSHSSWAWRSTSLSFHWRSGSFLRRSKRRACSSFETEK